MERPRTYLPVDNEKVVWLTPTRVCSLHTGTLALATAVACYLTAMLAGTLVLFPEAVSPLGPGCAVLVSVLALAPFRIWPVLIAAGLAGFVFHDVQFGFPPRTTAVFIVANTIEALIAAVPLRYSVDGIPRLNSLKAFAKYSFFAVLLASLVSASLGALATPGNYWIEWRIWFFSEALAYLILTPALLRWLSPPSIPRRQSAGSSRLEFFALTGGLASLGCVLFFLHWKTISPGLLYSLVPFLLWAALRFGPTGVGTCMTVVSFFAVWVALTAGGPSPVNTLSTMYFRCSCSCFSPPLPSC